MDNKKVLGISIAAVVVLVVAIIATSYAVFTANITGHEENVLTTGYVTMRCTETTFNVTNTQPMTDAQGIAASGNAATCTLTSEMSGTMTVGYDVALTDVDADTPSDSLGEGNVKIQASKTVNNGTAQYLAGTTASTGKLVSDTSIKNASGTYDTTITNYKIDSSTVTGNSTIVYTIKAWVASEATGTNNTSNQDGECSDTTYATQSTCEAAGEIWGYRQRVSQAGGSFSFKLKVGASQVLS